MNDLIADMLFATFDNELLAQEHDAAVFPSEGQRMAFSTDTFTISPLFFPGGDIGSLAVHGTVNDLAMAGAIPRYLSLGFVLEEGFAMADLWRIVLSIKEAADNAEVKIATGDTKVVEKGKGDGIYINTAGVGVIDHKQEIRPSSVRPGDRIIINGDIGRHGMAIMSYRDGLQFETPIQSDSDHLNGLVKALLDADIEIHTLRDLTRGGLASALNEIGQASQTTLRIEEEQVPVHDAVAGACEILGFDPLYVANEGKLIALVPERDAPKALALMQSHDKGEQSRIIGTVEQAGAAPVLVESGLGAARILDMMSGEQLPRIC
jgi:hydrogenase expression/formation protein HypE